MIPVMVNSAHLGKENTKINYISDETLLKRYGNVL